MIRNFFALLLLSLTVSACDSGWTTGSNANAGNNASANTSAPALPSLDANTLVKFPFADFPPVDTTAKPGEYLLGPSKQEITELSRGEGKTPSVVYYGFKMVKPGPTESEVEGSSKETETVPNAYLIPIPAGQKASTGDIVLTWWQSGSGMQRAIVIDAANPTEPIVSYLDRPSEQDKQEKLKPDTFVKLSEPFQPGTAVAIKSESRLEHAQAIRVAGDKVFVTGWGGSLRVVNKADCTPIPIKPLVKTGDKVKAMSNG